MTRGNVRIGIGGWSPRAAMIPHVVRPVLLLFLVACADPPPAPPTLEDRRKAIAADVRALVADLEAAGRYDCCIQAPCNLCATRAGGCRCGESLRRGEPVCEEC